jgi:pimeloyl-ACP methyl ester carboxylesterase
MLKVIERRYISYVVLIALLGSLLLMGGCQQTAVETSTPDEAVQARTIVDQAGREVTLPLEVNRVISTWRPCTFLVYAVGGQEKLVGVDIGSTKAPFTTAVYPEIADLAQVGDKKSGINVEEVVAANPDVVFVWSGKDSENLINQLEQQKIPAVVLIPVDSWGIFQRLPYHRLTYWYTRSKVNEKLYKWTGKYDWLVRWSLASSLIGDKSKITDALTAEVQRAMLEPGAGQPFISFQKSEITKDGLKTDLFSRLGEIMIPTLLIHGSQDKAVPLKDAVAASKLIPDCELYIMKGCKHWPQKERPEEFSQAVDDFVTQQIGQTE